jgi:hypothetical protein
MACRVDTAPLLAGKCVVSLYSGHGVRGDAVPSTGTHGPSPLYRSLSLPADAANEYRWGIVSPPAVGTLAANEDGSYSYTPPGGATDLTVAYTFREWQNGVDLGTAVETIVMGVGSGPVITPAATTSPSTASTAGIVITGGAGSISVAAAATASASTAGVAGVSITDSTDVQLEVPIFGRYIMSISVRRIGADVITSQFQP